MNFKLETEFSKAAIFKEVDALKKQIDNMRPLPEDVEGRVMQKLRLDWNYHSNAIEGNKLSYGETVAFLMEGITAKGKPLKDHLDIRGHNEAINFLLSIVKDPRALSEADIRGLHKMTLVEPYESKAQTPDGLDTIKRITLGEYKTSSNHVKTATGEIHYYASPEETHAKMQELMEWHTEVSANNEIHPVVIAALFHHKFVAIHPFDDGNGRLSRILMNLVLMKNGYPPVIIKMDDRTNYYALLNRADNNDSWSFVVYITEHARDSLSLYLKAAIGVEIDEDEDIDKEITLFKMELYNDFVYKEVKSREVIHNVLKKMIEPLYEKLTIAAKKFDEFFFSEKNYLALVFPSNRIETFRGFNKALYDFVYEKYPKAHHPLYKGGTLEYLALQFIYNKFKNPENSFDLTISVYIIFKDSHIEILDNDEKLLLIKFYHDEIHSHEIKIVSKSLVENIKRSIKEKVKQSPES